jgi:hypothetical protein
MEHLLESQPVESRLESQPPESHSSESKPPESQPLIDSDNDGLDDAREAVLGTDPTQWDTDKDGISDGIEVDGLEGLDLPAMGASPLHADIFIEIDWMEADDHSHAPNEHALALIKNAFSRSPWQNPDGSTGITLHIDRGEWGGGEALEHVHVVQFDRWRFDAIKYLHFNPNRAGIFHYSLWVHQYTRSGSSGIAELIGDDFMVAMGGFWHKTGTIEQQAGTLMHELGHNLGLQHGGNEEINYKPNYFSVMNYLFQFSGVDGISQRTAPSDYDYSHGTAPSTTEAEIRADLDGDGFLHTTLYDHNDWSALTLDWKSPQLGPPAWVE